ncbi:MAG TPA: sigma-70 family RNA polymerase sigma factor [Gemmataceae bacterium]|jgi:RNA polymerase sigma factor (sigma-70 family)|nr:sigma-70 family RNA polymerase sigma factor [Gemmataceae bacterium]
MAQRPNSPLLRYLHRLFENKEIAALTDRQLLQRFAADRSETAFTVLVRRHGAMVLGVCGRVLNDVADAEDAFQATFLVLARKGRSFGWHDSIGNWLYGVALRVASKMKAQRQRNNRLNANVRTTATAGMEQKDPCTETMRRELSEKLDAALRRLPNKYRAPLVLCYLEGKTHQQAARELGLPVGSMSRHMARGLELLRERLAQSQLCLSVEALTGVLAHGTWRTIVDRTMTEATAQSAVLFKLGTLAAAGTVSGRIITVAEGVLRTMILTNVKFILIAVLMVGMLGAGGLQGGRHLVENRQRDELAPVPERAIADRLKSPLPYETQEGMSPSNPVERERRHHLILSKLEKPVTLDKGLDRMTFGEAKAYFEDRFEITILVNEKAFLVNEKAFPEGSETLEANVKLDKLSGVTLGTTLQMMLDQFGGIYLVRPDFIEIATPEFVRPESWVTGDRTHVPRVHEDFDDVPLDQALRGLGIDTGIAVVLDRRKFDNAGQPHVTALFDGVCLDTAVELLANMCGLKAIAVDRTLYVTDEENADKLRAQQEQRQLAREKLKEKLEKEEAEKKKAKEQKQVAEPAKNRAK